MLTGEWILRQTEGGPIEPTAHSYLVAAVAADAARQVAEQARSTAENSYRTALVGLEPYLAAGPVSGTIDGVDYVVTRVNGVIELAEMTVAPEET